MSLRFSMVVPVYNDAYFAERLCVEFDKAMKAHLKTDVLDDKVELIFVDDGSRNTSILTLASLCNQYKFVRVIELSRNFGQHIAIACGFREARGEIVGRMNVDMQDSPSDIPRLLEAIESEDVDMVIGCYEKREHGLSERLTAWLYYEFFKVLTGLTVPQNTAALRVMNRKYIDAYNTLHEKTRFPQGLDEWFGFKKKYVSIAHHKRTEGTSAYNFFSRLALAIDGILAFSDKPLRLILYIGFCIAVFGFLAVAYLIVGKLLYNTYVHGYVSLVAIILGSFGVQMMCIGITGLYIGRILRETQDRPLYVIRNKYP